MKIISIRIKNLASLEGISEIDFRREPLSSAGIFAITGPTGAGKSTLLDALCLALYSKTPRYLQARESGVEIQDVTGNKISQGDIRGILRDGTAEGFAEVEFTGVDNLLYKATWSVRRARNKAEGSLQPDTIELLNLSTNIIFPGRKTETLKEIERLVGLNFEQFTRSVLLAQGDFTAFLKADRDSKSSLLEKLTGTDIYSDISKLIYEKYKQADQELGNLKSQIQGITILSEEELKSLIHQKDESGKQISEFEKQLILFTNEINWHNTLKALAQAKENAEKEWINKKHEKENATERINTFNNVESVQPARTLVEAKSSAYELFQQKSNALDALLLRIKELNKSTDAITLKLKAADKIVLEKESEILEAKPKVDKAKQLDTLIQEKRDRVKVAERELDVTSRNKEELKSLLQGKELEINDQSEKIEQLDKWKHENISRQPIAENIALISSKLTDAGKLLFQQEKVLESIRLNNSKIESTNEDFTKLSNTVSEKDKASSEINAEFLSLKNDLLVVPINTLISSESSLNSSIEESISAKGHWALLFASLNDQNVIKEKLRICKKDLVDKNKDLIEKKKLLQDATIKKQQTEKLLSQAKLQIAENVEDIRSQLIDGEECPVCGSKEHPFSAHNPQLDKVLKGLEKAYDESNGLFEQLLKDESSLERLCEKLEIDKLTLENDIEINSRKVSLMNEKWQSFKIDEACFQLNENERLAWFELSIKNLKLKLQQTQTKIDSFNKLKNNLDLRKEAIDKLNNELIAARDLLKETKQLQISINEEGIRLADQLNKLNIELEEITTLLTPNFIKSDWIKNWKKDATKFTDTIKTFAENWKIKIGALDTGKNNLNILKTAFHGFQIQLEALIADVDAKEKKLLELQDNLLSLVKQREAIFNGQEITIIEQNLKKAIDDAIFIQKGLTDEKAQVNDELIKANANKDLFNKDILTFRDSVDNFNTQIDEWITQYNSTHSFQLNEESLNAHLQFTSEWIDTERKSINDINDAITRAKATLEERVLQLSNHEANKISDRSLEEVAELYTNTKATNDLRINEKNEIDFKLRSDAENKIKAGALLKEIESKNGVYENWSKLNDLIGSADGKKFRQIAQEYTLDILLGFANIHLLDLSNRYKLLRIPESLGLQVLDKDMGDELRTVYSLSGGESFLVSLALALGLASLSSNKMKVESLFIDEGFGSLDPATLNIAMDALERLHSQGRKVGVISHVQEMTERIPTQIKVSKLSNGKSKIEVIGI